MLRWKMRKRAEEYLLRGRVRGLAIWEEKWFSLKLAPVHGKIYKPERSHFFPLSLSQIQTPLVFQALTWTCRHTPKGKLSRAIIGKRLPSGGCGGL